MTTRTGRRRRTGSPSRRNDGTIVFVDKRGLGDPKVKPFVVARRGVITQRVRALVLHGTVRLRYEPKGIEIWDSEDEGAGGFIVEAFLEYWPDE